MFNLEAVMAFLQSPTPKAWFEQAPSNLESLLIDHAHCERKAAQFAIKLINSYPDKKDLVHYASRLAREELVHFERVLKLLRHYGFSFKGLSSSNYASYLLASILSDQEERAVQQLIVAAFIEARSCERFVGLGHYLDKTLADFYSRLASSESRHFEHYLNMAIAYSDSAYVDKCISKFRPLENAFIKAPATVFRFHSGPLMDC